MTDRLFAELADHVTINERQALSPTGTRLRARRIVHSTPGRIDLEGAADHTLIYHVGGSRDVTQFSGRHVVHSTPDHCSLTVVPGNMPTAWSVPKPVDTLQVYLDDDALRRSAAEHLDLDAARIEITPAWSVRDPLVAGLAGPLAAEIARASDGPAAAASNLVLDQFAALLGAHLLSACSNVAGLPLGRPRPADARIARMLEFIEAHLEKTIRLEEMAAVACISVFHFTRVFREATGRTPATYVVHRRVARAKTLLRGPAPLAQVALACGFASQSHFGEVFKAHVGASPGAWRREVAR